MAKSSMSPFASAPLPLAKIPTKPQAKTKKPASRSDSIVKTTKTDVSPAPALTLCLKAPKIIKFGSDFSGMDAAATAMHRMFSPDKFKVMFASDILLEVHGLARVKPGNQPLVMYNDVRKRSLEDMSPVDVYVWTPPCQAFSTAGKRKGRHDPRGTVLAVGVKYIVHHRPRLTIFENVKSFMDKRFGKVVAGIEKALVAAGYHVFWKILNAKNFQVPQSRARVVMVAIRGDSLKLDFSWPEPLPEKATLTSILDPLRPSDKPGRLPNREPARSYVRKACGAAYAKGVNPLVTAVSVDIDCSPNFQSVGVDVAMTLTRTRGGGGPGRAMAELPGQAHDHV